MIDRSVVTAIMRAVLVPSLCPGQRVIGDHLGVHRNAEVRSLIDAEDCSLHLLPASSPEFNPIAPAFSRLKTLRRRIGTQTCAELDEAIATAVPQLTAADARAWVRHCCDGQIGQQLSERLSVGFRRMAATSSTRPT